MAYNSKLAQAKLFVVRQIVVSTLVYASELGLATLGENTQNKRAENDYTYNSKLGLCKLMFSTLALCVSTKVAILSKMI